ncbi:MAG: CoA:oxalate CoA-transferase [Lysobacterales bacterium]|jgi:CoA:oxalate CoA-transferase
MSKGPNKPLAGIRILDLTHMVSGPFGGMVLADMGAETIKVEPLQGEGTRKWCENDPEMSIDGMGVYFMTLNRNKKSVAIDLKTPDGLELFYDLVRVSDVVLNNFGAGVPERLKIDFDSLSQVNPGIITCSITGYGSDGPDNQRAAFDIVAQATSGMMSVTGTDVDHPVRTGTPVADIGAGIFAATGILAAIVERQTSGLGQHVDISMLDCQLSVLNYLVSMYGFTGNDPVPMGNSHIVHVPYNNYVTADGFIVIAVLTDSFWQNLKKVLCCEDLNDHRFDSPAGRVAHRDFIEQKINEILPTQSSRHWLDRLRSYRVPAGPVNRMSEALQDPQLLHRNMVIDIKHPNGETRKAAGNPIKMSRSNEESFSPAPLLGQDTDEVLYSLLNYDAARIQDLKTKGVIG